MSDFNEGDTIIVFYFNKSTGKPNERRCKIQENTGAKCTLKEKFTDNKFIFEKDSERLLKVKSNGETKPFGKDASLSEPF